MMNELGKMLFDMLVFFVAFAFGVFIHDVSVNWRFKQYNLLALQTVPFYRFLSEVAGMARLTNYSSALDPVGALVLFESFSEFSRR